MTHIISSDCIQCGACEAECENNAISEGENTYVIDSEKCKDCGLCADVCPTNAIYRA
jgi:ferredoxin